MVCPVIDMACIDFNKVSWKVCVAIAVVVPWIADVEQEKEFAIRRDDPNIANLDAMLSYMDGVAVKGLRCP